MAKLMKKVENKKVEKDEQREEFHRNRMKAFKFINEGFKDNKKLALYDDKEEIITVKTILPSLNRALVIGGYPMGTIGEAHGPNGGGKTALGIGILRSFLTVGHLGIFCDSERAANDKKWIANLAGYGIDLKDIFYFNPDHLEDASDRINTQIDRFKEAKYKGVIDRDTLLFLLVDSATKLVPKDMVKKGLSGGHYGKQALLMSEWLKTLTPLVGPKHDEKGDVAILFVNQERVNVGAKPWEPKFKSTCGEALQFEATMRVRVSYSGAIKEKVNGKEIKVGKKHKILIEKNKVGFPESIGTFYTSNGLGSCPLGFDIAKDVFEECKIVGLVKNSGTSYESDFWNGTISKEKNVLDFLRDNEDVIEELINEHHKLVISGKAPATIKSISFDSSDSEEDEE